MVCLFLTCKDFIMEDIILMLLLPVTGCCSLQVPVSVREQDFSGRVVAILLSLQNEGTRRDECHITRSKGEREREKEMVSGGMLDAIFVLVEIEMIANCLSDSFDLQRHICVGADDS